MAKEFITLIASLGELNKFPFKLENNSSKFSFLIGFKDKIGLIFSLT
jgi:hypothetical protein